MANFPNLDRLKSQLLTSGLQQKDNPLYQVIDQLIGSVRQIQQIINAAIESTSGSVTDVSNLDFLTSSNESPSLPNSRELLAGTNITFDDTTPNERTVNAPTPNRDETILTATDETATLPNSRELIAGTNVSFDDTTPNERTINVTGSGSGDVVGPASAVDDDIATFNTTTGKLIQDGGSTIAQVIAAAIAGSGDVVGPASAVDGNLAIFDGTTGKLIKDGGAPTSGDYVLIEEQTPSGVGTITFSSLGAYTHLEIRWLATGTQSASNTNMFIRFNGDTGSNYDRETLNGFGTTPSATEGIGGTSAFCGNVIAATGPANAGSGGRIEIPDYRNTTFQKYAFATNGFKQAITTGTIFNTTVSIFWRDTSAITSITLLLASGNYVAGSKFSLYGIN